MSYEETRQVYAEILFILQYMGVRLILKENIQGFTECCKFLQLDFMLGEFKDVCLLEFIYSQISSTSRCLISKLIRWKACHFMIGHKVNLYQIINSIRQIASFLSL